MNSFLSLVAQNLIERFGENLSDVTVVFPNKRAGIFLNQELVSLSPTPVWAPRYLTISELFRLLSPYTLIDPIQAVCELYDVYASLIENPESLDRFYGWGEIMLADFDDIDKHLAKAEALFSNVRAIKELDTNDFLTPEQESALRHFFEGFSLESNTKLKEKFLQIWNVMGQLYTEFNRRLMQKGLLYEGALYRHVIEHIEKSAPLFDDMKTYVFVGFNVLDDVEVSLFSHLQQRNKALFYWDYDTFYTVDQPHAEAGVFIRENLRRFPNALTEDVFSNLLKDKYIEFIAASSENAQVRYLPQWLQQNLRERESETAIVLCNESLLQPALHALPSGKEIGHVRHLNVTMGYPLTDTPIFGFINALLTLQTEGYNPQTLRFRPEALETVKLHPFVHYIDTELLQTHNEDNATLIAYLNRCTEQVAYALQQEENTDVNFLPLYNEALFQTHNVLTRFSRLLTEGLAKVNTTTLSRLLRTVIQSVTIPFHGEPAIGLQVMGVLETRNLDFNHIALLSVNEGKLPKNIVNTSFIPYFLRESFGLTTVRHKIAVYAFYFYRLLQRASRITLFYNTADNGTGQGEMSRFMLQLLAETKLPIRRFTLQADMQLINGCEEIQVKKDTELINQLHTKYQVDPTNEREHGLSPSALNVYIDCPLKFYYTHLAGIKIKKSPSDGIDAALFGTLFHKAAENLYRHLSQDSSIITSAQMEDMADHLELSLISFVDDAFRSEYFHTSTDEQLPYTGQLLIVRKVLLSYLAQVFRYDMVHTPMEIIGMEKSCRKNIDIESSRGPIQVCLAGIIDRMDIIEMVNPETGESQRTLRILDYKTGGQPETAQSMEQLFTPSANRPHYMLQTMLYCLAESQKTSLPVAPALFFVHKSNAKDYSPYLTYNKELLTDVRPLRNDFEEALRKVLQELFDPQIPFTQTQETTICRYCDYRLLCGK